jgi:hypothetical protein
MIAIEQIANKNIYVFQITEEIDQEGVEKFLSFLAAKAEKGEKMKMIGEVKSFTGFENFKAFTETAEMKLKAASSISKYAVLSDKDWVQTVIPVADLITPNIPIKHFALNERDQAIEWLEIDGSEEEE